MPFSRGIVHTTWLVTDTQQLVRVVSDGSVDVGRCSSSPREENIRKRRRSKFGPTPLHVKFPGIVKAAKEYISSVGSAAQARRRDTSATAFGASLKDIRKEILRKVEWMEPRGIS